MARVGPQSRGEKRHCDDDQYHGSILSRCVRAIDLTRIRIYSAFNYGIIPSNPLVCEEKLR
jgi:hypothetical protein